MIFHPVIFFFAVLAIFLAWNTYVIVGQDRSPNHTSQFLWRALIWTLGSVYYGGQEDLGLVATYFVAFHLAFWFPFNTGLNLLRQRAWNYLGQTAWIDKQMRKWPDAAFLLSVLLTIIGVGLMIWPKGY